MRDNIILYVVFFFAAFYLLIYQSIYKYREKHAQEEDNKALAQAPSTILSGDALPDIGGLDLLFKPSMGEMSSLALPENLPLDFIASECFFFF